MALRAYYRRLCSRMDKLGMLMVPIASVEQSQPV